MDDTYFALKYGLPVCFQGLDDLDSWWRSANLDYSCFERYGQFGLASGRFFPYTFIGDENDKGFGEIKGDAIDCNTIEYMTELRKALAEYDKGR